MEFVDPNNVTNNSKKLESPFKVLVLPYDLIIGLTHREMGYLRTIAGSVSVQLKLQ